MAAVLTLGLMAACAPVATRPAAVSGGSASGGPVTAGPVQVGVEGQSFAVTIAAGAPGVALTRAGAVPVAGNRISVTRGGSPLGQADGAMAKRAARQGCEAQGGRFNAAALGRHAGSGIWSFDGGCA